MRRAFPVSIAICKVCPMARPVSSSVSIAYPYTVAYIAREVLTARAWLLSSHLTSAAWNSSELPIFEPGLYEVVKSARSRGNLQFSTDFTGHVAEADIIFVRCLDVCSRSKTRLYMFFCCTSSCQYGAVPLGWHPVELQLLCSVNTPTKSSGVGAGKAADLTYWEKAARMIAKVSTSSKIVVEKSTVPVKTADAIEKASSSCAMSAAHFVHRKSASTQAGHHTSDLAAYNGDQGHEAE